MVVGADSTAPCMWKDTKISYQCLALFGRQQRRAELLLAVRKGAVVPVALLSVLTAAGASLVSCEAAMLLAKACLEHVGMVQHLILRMRILAREA